MGLYTHPRVQWLDGNGDPLAGGKLNFYIAGSATRLNTYSVAALTVGLENANPVVADANGTWGPIWLRHDQSYKVVLTDANDVGVWTQDGVGPHVDFPFSFSALTTVASMTVLAKSGLSDGVQVQLAGYSAINDGGGGTFYWHAGSSTTANAGTVFAADEGGTGRWKRVEDGARFNARWFGAKGDGSTNDYAAIINAVKAANEHRLAADLSGVEVYFPEGHYTVSAGIPLTYATYLIGAHRNGAILDCTGSTATIFSATYSAGVFTDNLDRTLAQINAGASASIAGVIDLDVQQTGTIAGNSPSGTAWNATIMLHGCPDVQVINVNVSNETNSKNGIFLKYSWRACVENLYCPRGGAFSGGSGLAIDSQCNSMLVSKPFVFGNWAIGIEAGASNSTTILEPNVELGCDVGIRLGGLSPRILGGYFEGNTIDIQLGASPTAPVNSADVQRTWHNGSSTDHAIDIQAATNSIITRPFMTGTFSVSNFKSNADVANNLGNLIEIGVSDATTVNLTTLGLLGGRNIVRCYGDVDDDHRFYVEYQSRTGKRIETELNQRGAQFVCFEVKLINDGGTLKIAIQDSDEANTTYDACFAAGASATLVAIPDVSAGAGFGAVAGGRLTGTLNMIVLNTNGSASSTQAFIAGQAVTNCGTALTAQVRQKSRDVNGVTLTRAEILIGVAATGAAFDFDTTNFTAGEYIRVPILGFIS